MELLSLEVTKDLFGTLKVGRQEGNIGLEPTVYLDEKKRFLDHLNQIRRVSIGPDQSDSAGYGLYLVRLPVSITPGECTYHGFGADLAVSVEHEFGKSFLPSTIRNLVVNDLVGQLGPVVYEIIRNGTLDKVKALEAQQSDLKSRHAQIEASMLQLIAKLSNIQFSNLDFEEARKQIRKNANKRRDEQKRVQQRNAAPAPIPEITFEDGAFRKLPSAIKKSYPFARYLTRSPAEGQSLEFQPNDPLVLNAVADRLDVVLQALLALQKAKPFYQ